jgi:hypothetical protein
MRDVVTVLVSAILAISGGGGIAGLLFLRLQKRLLGATVRRENAEAETTLSSAAIELIAPYRQSVADARDEAKAAHHEAATAGEEATRANQRADRAERRIARLEQLGGLHMIWDQEAQAEVERLGGHLRQPPTLDDLEPM